MIKKPILILGAGPCGLGAAYRLNNLGHTDWQLFERNDHVGGLSSSFLDDKGFTWDVGGHVLFSHYDYFDRAVEAALGDDSYHHQRESWIRILQTWVPYPFQNNVRYLPDAALRECMDGLQNMQGNSAQSRNFHEWIDSVFGAGIVKYFMAPYNAKVWGVPLEAMSKAWIAERISVVDLARIEKNIAEKRDDLSWGPNNTFLFPKQGGTGTIYERIAQSFSEKIVLNQDMSSIDLENRIVKFADGRSERYNILINSTPLDQFIKKCSTVPAEVSAAISGLVHNGGYIVGLGFRGKRDDSTCWMYFPEGNCPFYRVTNFHNYSRFNVPGGDTENFFALMCETTYSTHKPVDKDVIVEETVLGLINTGMITAAQRSDIVSTWLMDIPYSYPVPTLGRDDAIAIIQPFLESNGIYSRGRFGAWKYEVGNMDHSFMQGVEAVDRVLLGKSESTVVGNS